MLDILQLFPDALVAVARDVFLGGVLAIGAGALVCRAANRHVRSKFDLDEPQIEVADIWAGIDEARERHPAIAPGIERRAA